MGIGFRCAGSGGSRVYIDGDLQSLESIEISSILTPIREPIWYGTVFSDAIVYEGELHFINYQTNGEYQHWKFNGKRWALVETHSISISSPFILNNVLYAADLNWNLYRFTGSAWESMNKVLGYSEYAVCDNKLYYKLSISGTTIKYQIRMYDGSNTYTLAENAAFEQVAMGTIGNKVHIFAQDGKRYEVQGQTISAGISLPTGYTDAYKRQCFSYNNKLRFVRLTANDQFVDFDWSLAGV